MATPIQSPYSNILPFLTGIPLQYWKQKAVLGGSILITGKPSIETEHLFMMVHSPNLWTVSYTGDSLYPQFSELSMGVAYRGQCAAFAKAVVNLWSTPTDKWLPWMMLQDFANTMESRLPSEFQGLMIACFDGKPNYALASGSKKHVAILLDIIRNSNGTPKEIVVVDQNYFCFAPYQQYAGKIARHTIPWWNLTQKWVGYARSYNIVNM